MKNINAIKRLGLTKYFFAISTALMIGGFLLITFFANVKTSTAADKLVIGNRVWVDVKMPSNPKGLNVRVSPGLISRVVGVCRQNNQGTVVGGPKIANGLVWWQINYDNGLSGWSTDRYLELAPPATLGVKKTAPVYKFKVGDRAYVSSQSAAVKSSASSYARNLGSQPKNAQGIVISGPKSANNLIWWQINYDKGVDGWSADKYLDLVLAATTTPPVATSTPPIATTTPPVATSTPPIATTTSQYFLHKNITSTVFWVGEPQGGGSSEDNALSAWDDEWQKDFGGFDDPANRNGYYPVGFTPKENPFYLDLPYNDFNDNGNRKANAKQVVPWANEKTWGAEESMMKNRWVKLIRNGVTCYGQIEDAGPYQYDDYAYVFGTSLPKSKLANNAGLDVSPALRDCLKFVGLNDDSNRVDWQFIKAADVPAGPWSQIITTSQINWP